jgi:hypothetical protein
MPDDRDGNRRLLDSLLFKSLCLSKGENKGRNFMLFIFFLKVTVWFVCSLHLLYGVGDLVNYPERDRP